MLQLGRLDLVIAPKSIATKIIKELTLSQTDFNQVVLDEMVFYHYLRKRNAHLLASLKDEFSQLIIDM